MRSEYMDGIDDGNGTTIKTGDIKWLVEII